MSEEISTYQGPRLIQISGNKIEWVNHGETLQYFRTLFKYILIFINIFILTIILR